jgi:membrane protease YdiL (CAAX protease family)
MFIEQGIKAENKFWKYIVGSILIVLASAIGQIPLLLAVMLSAFSAGEEIPNNQDAMLKYLDSNLTLFLMLISFVFAIAALLLVNRYLHKQSTLSILSSRTQVDWRRIMLSFSIWTIITIGSTVLLYFGSPENFEVNFKPIPFLILALVAIPLIPIQTTCEELVFRGYLMQGFSNLAGNKWFPLLMTSLIFGVMHIFNPEVDKMGPIILVYYIGTGLFLGIITLMDEGLELAMGFHAANNLVGALLVTTDWTVFQTNSILKDLSEPTAGFDVLLPVVVIYPLLLFVFGRIYRWQDWRDKLAGNISLHQLNK